MAHPDQYMGIDIGSVSISVSILSERKEPLGSFYFFHYGDVAATLRKCLRKLDFSRIKGIAATRSTPPSVRAFRFYDNRLSIIRAARHFHRQVGGILVVGGEKFGLIRFDAHGQYLGMNTNTSCAAGTGSFLDQQAKRLKLSGIDELSRLAFENTGKTPKIASRCAVFAKTDLVHAQQEGYTLAEICDGLCHGLARNIVDTLLSGDIPPRPMVIAGGVSKNRAVVRHLERLMGLRLVREKHPYESMGAALNLIEDMTGKAGPRFGCRALSLETLIDPKQGKKTFFYPCLKIQKSRYPDFDSLEQYEYLPPAGPWTNPVEVDVYRELVKHQIYQAYVGIDIGSTSTKAVILDLSGRVLAGCYTRTSGKPLDAVQALFQSIRDIMEKKNVVFQVSGLGTTGSGRKFAGNIFQADQVVDEITAHARAAHELNPEVDTIIEIGGQDSKFTILSNGRVVFAVMNTVCAAGTGSFIEEQALKLQLDLKDYTRATEDKQSPMASDRCTVFMERDINHLLIEGYSREEVLASVLHSVCENYLTKVAVEKNIGRSICFQGATAKNRALVAAFEQRLGRPIFVSKFCHLTGALGAALLLRDQKPEQTKFRGFQGYPDQITIKSEVCGICTNHCKISMARIGKKNVAYGFLCGRDYDTRQYVSKNRSGFDLIREKARIEKFQEKQEYRKGAVIGIPAALHLQEDVSFWRIFFDTLSIKTVISGPIRDAVKTGMNLANAEFCAPVAALHGHAKSLAETTDPDHRVDHIFLPYYFEKRTGNRHVRRQYCYYSQFAPSLVVSALEGSYPQINFLMPMLNYLYSSFHKKVELYRMLKGIFKGGVRFLEVSAAFERAMQFKSTCRIELQRMYEQKSRENHGRMHVVLLGRPYIIDTPHMNRGIPGIFASMGIRVFTQDMLPRTAHDLESIQPLLDKIHWLYASKILEAAEITAQTDGAYPVFITSFKCSPDSFVIDYFKKIMESHGKPYLILQLDEHQSSVGYETRIEAAVRSFNNHHHLSGQGKTSRSTPVLGCRMTETISDKTLVLPNWDDLSLKLVVANLRREGIDARLMEGSRAGIKKGLRQNSGQCIPLNIIVQDFIDYVQTHDLNPEKTVFWMVASVLSCNLGIFPYYIKHLLQSHGRGMEKAGVYRGSLTFADISMKLSMNTYFAYMFGGLLRKVGCKIRPYEKKPGDTDRVIERSMDLLLQAFSGRMDKEEAVIEVAGLFKKIEKNDHPGRPKVAVFGDLYVRDNELMNQDLFHFIEDQGGEVVTTPYSHFVKMIAGSYLRKWLVEGHYLNVLSSQAIYTTVTGLEKKYYKHFSRLLDEPDPVYKESPKKILANYNLRIEHTGESMENILKIFYTLKYHPDLSLFVQTSPAFCCPSLVTEAMAKKIEANTGIPVVSITYDGTGGNKNDVLIPYITFAGQRTRPFQTLGGRKKII